jgi:hypothetical protein
MRRRWIGSLGYEGGLFVVIGRRAESDRSWSQGCMPQVVVMSVTTPTRELLTTC